MRLSETRAWQRVAEANRPRTCRALLYKSCAPALTRWLDYVFGICKPDQRIGKRGSRCRYPLLGFILPVFLPKRYIYIFCDERFRVSLLHQYSNPQTNHDMTDTLRLGFAEYNSPARFHRKTSSARKCRQRFATDALLRLIHPQSRFAQGTIRFCRLYCLDFPQALTLFHNSKNCLSQPNIT